MKTGGVLCSFTPDTVVLLEDGKTKQIKDVRTGDEVEAADPGDGKQKGTRAVTATHINRDYDLVDATIRAADGSTSTIHTTSKHPFWDDTTHTWTTVGALPPGHALNTDTDQHVPVLAVTTVPGSADMYNLTVDELHTYYVMAGRTPVLVHNFGCDEFAATLQKSMGGEVHTFTGPGGDSYPIGSRYKLDPNEEIWFHHTVVVKDGRVFDQFTGSNGMPIDDRKAQWKPNDLDF